MRKLPVFVLALLVVVAAIGCDSSNEDDESDAEVIVGTWELVKIEDDEADRTPVFGQLANSFVATFNADNTFTALVDYVQDPDFPLGGTYQVVEATRNLLLTIGTLQPGFEYEIVSDSQIRLSAPSDVVNGIFQTDLYVGEVVITFNRQ